MREISLPILIGSLVWLSMPGGPALADDDSPCRMFLCMAGKVQGNGEAQGCESAISSYFSYRYQVYDPDFDQIATTALRDSVIGQCSGIESDVSGRNVQLRLEISKDYGWSQNDF